MERVFIIVIIILVIRLMFYSNSKKKHPVKTGNIVLKKTAENLGIKFIKGGFFNYPKILGEIDGLQLFAGWNKIYGNSIESAVFEISVRYNYSVRGKLRIVTSSPSVLVPEYEADILKVEIGDPDFDQVMDTGYTGKPDTAIAILTFELRREILELAKISDYFKVSRYGIYIYNINADVNSPESITSNLKRIVSLANLVLSLNDFRTLHIHNIIHDPVKNVRLNNLRILNTSYPVDREISLLLKECLNDKDLEIQFEAARHLQPEGLNFIIKLINDNKLHDRGLLVEAIKAFGDFTFKESADLLKELFKNHNHKTIRVEILKAFKNFSDEKISPFLVSLLESDDDYIIEEAVGALGTCGDIYAVEKLLHLAEHSINPFFRSMINDSIARIQSRLGDVEKGWLSVSEVRKNEGDLSLADGASEGAMSIIEGEKKI